MTRSRCPSSERIHGFAVGLLAGPEAESLGEHLSWCAECASAASAATSDTLLDALRDSTLISREDTTIRPLIERLQALPLAEGESAADSRDPLSFLAPPLEKDELGRLGGYRILSVLGIGGMGIVFEADDAHLRRKVALKVLKPSIASRPTARERFLREARAAAAIEHEHVVSIYHVGEERGLPYLVSPLLMGESLQQRLQRDNRLPIEEVLRIAREVATGLAAAHARGVVHRDIKPDNIWLDAQEKVRILDFGLASVADASGQLTLADDILGTPNYMSPEQALGQPVESRADLFSLGAVFYRLLTGQEPFVRPNVTSVLVAVAHDQPPAPSTLDAAIPADVSSLVMRLLEKEPARRPASAAQVVEEIRRIEADVSRRSRPMALPLAKRGRLSRRNMLAIAVAVACCLILAGSVFRVVTDRGVLVVDTGGDPKVKVALEKGGVKIYDQRRKRSYQLHVGEQALASGNYELQIQEAGGLQVETEEFVVERGKRRQIRAWIQPSAAGVDGPKGRKVTLRVPADQAWTATGIHLKDVRRISILASGAIRGGHTGEEREYYHDVPPVGREERLPQFPHPDLPGLGLIGRIGSGPVFFVGQKTQFDLEKVDDDDELFLGINDDVVIDNDGYWRVDITLVPRTSIAER